MDVLAAIASGIVVSRWMKYVNRYELCPWLITDVMIIAGMVVATLGVLAGLGSLTFINAAVSVAAVDLGLLLTSFVDSLIQRGMITPPPPAAQSRRGRGAQ